MNNPLVRKLIQMNQEKVALKTAHKRGLGMAKLYVYDLNIQGYDEDKEFYRVTATVKQGAVSYPVIDLLTNNEEKTVRRESSFSNNGMTFTCRFNILDSGIVVRAISTSPLSSLEGVWL